MTKNILYIISYSLYSSKLKSFPHLHAGLDSFIPDLV